MPQASFHVSSSVLIFLSASLTYGEALDLFVRDLVAEPPRTSQDVRLDLPLDLSGVYQSSPRPGIIAQQWIWQECLEVTISGNASYESGARLPAMSPLHHHIIDGTYVTLDDTETTTTGVKGNITYKAVIAAPTAMEAADGATAVLVMYHDDTMPGVARNREIAIRYIDSQGRLTFQQNGSAIAGAHGLSKLEKVANVSCGHPWTFPETHYCKMKKQEEPDKYNAFTPACCGEGYGESTALYTSIAHPKWKEYVANCAKEPMQSATLESNAKKEKRKKGKGKKEKVSKKKEKKKDKKKAKTDKKAKTKAKKKRKRSESESSSSGSSSSGASKSSASSADGSL